MMNEGPYITAITAEDKKENNFSNLPHELVVYLLDFVSQDEKELHNLRTISTYFNTTISTGNFLLNTNKVKMELQHSIHTLKDKTVLWAAQQEEIDFLFSQKETILANNKALKKSDFDEIELLSKASLSALNLYKRHKALNHINHKMIRGKINLKLDKLDCKNAFLTRCPLSIFTDSNLQTFWQKLRHFNLSGNRLKSLPLGSVTLPQLSWLNLTNNQLQYLDKISGLKSLKWLYLSNNELTNLPSSLTQLQLLTSLDIQHNRIETLPINFYQLAALTALNAQYNCLTELPINFGSSSQLMPDLRYNKLTELPDTLQEKKLINSETNFPISKAELLNTQLKTSNECTNLK